MLQDTATISSPIITVSAPDMPGGQQAFVSANLYNGNIVSVYVTTEGYVNDLGGFDVDAADLAAMFKEQSI